MPKFFFHLSDGTTTLRDHNGLELPTAVDARERVELEIDGIVADLNLVVLVTDEAGRHVYATGFSLPSAGRQILSRQRELYSHTERLGRIGGWEWEVGSKSIALTEGGYRVLGFPFESAPTYADCLALLTFDSRRRFKRAVVKSLIEDQSFEVEVWLAGGGANTRLRVSGHARRMTDAPWRVYGIVSEPDRKESVDPTWHLANHDGLTGLANRALFEIQLKQSIARAESERTKVGLVLLDIDHLKEVNDTLGHPVGDALLRSVASRLKASVRSSDLTARIGGDEFALVLTGLSDATEMTDLVESIQYRLQQPFDHSGRTISSGASAGIAIYPDHDGTADGLINDADIALNLSKSISRGSLTVYSREMRLRLEKRMDSLVNARTAISEGQIVPFYQPQVCIRTKTVTGFQALLRWCHPTKGILSTEDIAAAFDDAELSAAIGESLVQDILDDICSWTAQEFTFGRIAFGVSRMELMRPQYVSELLRQVELAGVSPAQLEIGIHEEALVGRGSDRAEVALKELRRAGIALALDDFGTGYGSLKHFKLLPIDTLKIERTFVSAMNSEPFAKAIICALIKMASAMRVRVVAEGVETLEQTRFLHQEGCDIFQGLYFEPPMSAADVPAFLQQWPARHLLAMKGSNP